MFAAWWCRPDSSIYYTHTPQTRENYGFKARDGVTTRLETDVEVNPVCACMQRARPGCHQLRSNEKNIFQRA
jgi:hypothetical protein